MILSKEEAQELLERDLADIYDWHTTAYKRREELMVKVPDQWNDQEAATQGQWAHGLILAAARDAEEEHRTQAKDGAARVVKIFDRERRLAAQLRFRRIELLAKLAGEPPKPQIVTPLSPTAKEWFGNLHLRRAWQPSLDGEQVDTTHLHTNLLIGHTADTVLGDFERLFVVCQVGAFTEWYFEISAGGGVVPLRGRDTRPRGPIPLQPIIHPKELRP